MKQTNKEGFKMPLPFLAGIAAGALAVVAWNKKDLIAKKVEDGVKKGSKIVGETYKSGQKIADKAIAKISNNAKVSTRAKSKAGSTRASKSSTNTKITKKV